MPIWYVFGEPHGKVLREARCWWGVVQSRERRVLVSERGAQFPSAPERAAGSVKGTGSTTHTT